MPARTRPNHASPVRHPAVNSLRRAGGALALRCGLLMLAALFTSACGQKGPLYLPQPSEQPQPAAPSEPDE